MTEADRQISEIAALGDNSDPILLGLSDGEVILRLQKGDRNIAVFRSSRTYREILRENVWTAFNISFGAILVLLAALGQITDAIFSGMTVIGNIVVGVFQEVKAKWALDKLALLSIQQVTVRRNGVALIIPPDEIVRDDLIELKPGDRPPVDGAVVYEQALEMDESLLTGESDLVPKQVGDLILSGSFCMTGSCLFRAEKIGNESYVNRLAQSSRVYKRSLTPLQTKINAIVEIFVLGLVVVGSLHIASSVNNGVSMVDTLRYGSVIINSFVPAGLVLTISVALAIGAVEISRQQTLIQRINAVDSMNSVRVLCTDKTGTLTQNKLAVREILPLADQSQETLQEYIAQYAHLVAAQNTSAKAMASFAGLPHQPWQKTGEVPFGSQLKWGMVELSNGNAVLVGSPELLLQSKSAKQTAQDFARQGLRVIAVAIAPSSTQTNKKELPKELPSDRQDAGLILLEDQLRTDAPATIAALRALGIQIKVISGDSVETVAAIAAQAGIVSTPDQTFSQAQLDSFLPQQFDRAANQGKIFGRITPNTKKELIAAMVRQGQYVAMVGDGVNDVPAFKEAKLAIAMNDGAQISKDVADIVLLNNSLATLPLAFQAGDAIKQKILASAILYLSKNIMLIVAILFVGFVRLSFPIEPRQNSVLTLATVAIPSVLISFGVLRPKRIHNFLRNVLGFSLIAGLVGGIAITIGYVFTYFGGVSLIDLALEETEFTPQLYLATGRGYAQAVGTMIGIVYGTLVLWELFQISIWKPRSFFYNRPAAITGMGAIVGAIALLLFSPDLFQIQLPSRLGWSTVIFVSFAAHYLLRMLLYGAFIRKIARSLTQP